jgi:hypothetical protein
MSPSIGASLTGISTEVRLLLKWWLHEVQDAWHAALTRMVPRHADRVWIVIGDQEIQVRWRQNGAAHEGPLLKHAGGWEESLSTLSMALAEARPGTRTHVQLGLSRVLLRDIVLPDLPERELAGVVALQVERVMPLLPDAIYVDWRLKQRLPERRRVVVTIAATKRDDIDLLRDRIAQTGLRIDEISAAGAPEEPTFNFSRLHVVRQTAAWERRDRALTVSLASIMVVWIALVLARMGYESHRIAGIAAEEHSRAQPARQLESQIRARVEPMERVRQLLLRPTATDLVVVLTQAIPADTWVYSAEISGGSTGETPVVKLSGFTPAATMLVDTLSKSQSLQSVKLVKASGTSGGIGIDRFEISAQLSRGSDLMGPAGGGL